MAYGNCKTYGKKGLLTQIFTAKRGFVTLPADVSLGGLDSHAEEE